MKLIGSALLCVSALLFTSCDKKEKLPGKREPIPGILQAEAPELGPSSMRSAVIVPPAITSLSRHVCTSGNKQHSAINHKMNPNGQRLSQISIGSGPILTDLIAFGGNVYAIDANGILNCVSQKDCHPVWKKNIAEQPDDGVFSGGMTADENGIIYVGTNIGTVFAIDSKNQKELWKKDLKVPMKGPPLCVTGKVIVTTVNNQTIALDIRNGEILWTKTVTQEPTMMSESSTPAVFGNSLICAYPSGDVMSLNIDDGSDTWNDVLFPANMSQSGSTISHFSASPVIWNGFVLVSMAEARMALIDAITGTRSWDREIGTSSTPAVIGNWAFILNNDGSVTCISLKDGRRKWVTDVKSACVDKNNALVGAKWIGPVIINGEIVVFNNAGHSVALDISTGRIKKQRFFKGAQIVRTPIIIDGKLFALTERAELYVIG